MTIDTAKEKLHRLIDHASEQKIMELLSFFDVNADKERLVYDEPTLNILRERSEQYLSGKSATYTLDESLELIKKYRLDHGL